MRYSAVVRFISPLYGQRFVKWFTTTFVTYTDFLGKDNIDTASLTGLVGTKFLQLPLLPQARNFVAETDSLNSSENNSTS